MTVPADPPALPCGGCGQPLAAGAAFCRTCGASALQPPATPSDERPAPPETAPAPGRPSREPRSTGRRAVLIAAATGLLVGGGVAAAFLLLAGDDSKQSQVIDPGGTATVPAVGGSAPIRSGEASSASSGSGAPSGAAAGSIEAGRYVQAGSFRTVEGAETERQRLREAGIEVSRIESDQTEELYPGFQVLLGGPLLGRAVERKLLKRLHDNGVPSAFGRELSAAAAIAGPEAIAGRWTGTLERTGTSRPGLNGSLPVTLTAGGEGDPATLTFSSLGCSVDLQLRMASAVSLTYGQARDCVGGGVWSLRPGGTQLSVALLPPNTDVIVLGDLSRH